MPDDPLRLDEADADLAAGRARPASEVFAALNTPDIAAALERLREALTLIHVIAENEGFTNIGGFCDAGLPALATIEARIAEVERERGAHEEMSQENYDNACARADEAEADLLLAGRQNTNLSGRLVRLEGALREIHEYNCGCDQPGRLDLCVAQPVVLFAALAEEPYADVPGAGQRGCG